MKPITTETVYKKALKRLELIFDAPSDSKEGREAEMLAGLIEDYEDRFFSSE